MHAHVGFLARGRVHGEYADGCGFEYAAPRVVLLEPSRRGVVGDDAVLIQFDAEEETARRSAFPRSIATRRRERRAGGPS